MIVKELNIDNTKILIDDAYMAKTEQEKEKRYEIFNLVGCEIYNSNF